MHDRLTAPEIEDLLTVIVEERIQYSGKAKTPAEWAETESRQLQFIKQFHSPQIAGTIIATEILLQAQK
jgi:hypothetical protein